MKAVARWVPLRSTHSPCPENSSQIRHTPQSAAILNGTAAISGDGGNRTPPSDMRPMMASEAQIAANRRNGNLGKGPVTDDGKAKSRMNAIKHGLTGAGVAENDTIAAVDARKAEWG